MESNMTGNKKPGIFNILILLLISLSIISCSSVEDGVHLARDYVTSTKIGKPRILDSVSTEKYVYSTLNENEKILYDQIYNCIIGFDSECPISTKDPKELNKIFSCVVADYGDIFWIDGYEYMTYTSGSYITGITFTPSYTMDRSKKDELQSEIDEVCSSWLAELPDGADDYEKSKFVFEKLIENVDYVYNANNSQNILSVFLGGATVCQGYAQASAYLLSRLGIPAVVLSGKANNESHAWNLIRLDGEYYYFDVTWGNSTYRTEGASEKFIDYTYLNTTTAQMEGSHELDVVFSVPECTSIVNSYFVREGLFFREFNPDEVGASITEAYLSSKSSISLKFDNPVAYNKAFDYIIGEKHFADYCPGLLSIAYLEDSVNNVLTLEFI